MLLSLLLFFSEPYDDAKYYCVIFPVITSARDVFHIFHRDFDIISMLLNRCEPDVSVGSCVIPETENPEFSSLRDVQSEFKSYFLCTRNKRFCIRMFAVFSFLSKARFKIHLLTVFLHTTTYVRGLIPPTQLLSSRGVFYLNVNSYECSQSKNIRLPNDIGPQ